MPWHFISLTCCSAPGHGVGRDDSWVAKTAEIQAVAVVVVLQKNREKSIIDYVLNLKIRERKREL